MNAAVERAKRIVATDPLAAIRDDVAFHGPAPIGELRGRDAVQSTVIAPIDAMLADRRVEPYVFLGGVWDDRVWVASTGDVVGTMTDSWLGIPASGASVRLRYGVFFRFDGDRVDEIRCLFDVVGLAAQAGFDLMPPFAGRPDHPPGPALGNGLSVDPQDPAESAFTLQLVEDMLGGCNRLVDGRLESMGMATYWHDDMRWYGPWGVGSTHGFDEFQRDAQGPSVASFPNRRGGFHRARIADGVTAAFTGWPSLRGTFDGVPFRGVPPSSGEIGQNIMDFYVRRDDRLHENWVLIDLIDFAAQCGIDLLEGLSR